MKTLVGLIFLLCAVAAFAQQGTRTPSVQPAVIQGSGCVSQAVESSCLVLKDSKTGETYNLLFADHPPAPGIAIRFKATEHQGMTTCMQGKAGNVTKWKRLKGEKCPATPAENAH